MKIAIHHFLNYAPVVFSELPTESFFFFFFFFHYLIPVLGFTVFEFPGENHC